MKEQNITLLERLKEMYNSQLAVSASLDYFQDPGSLKEVYVFSTEILNRVSNNTFSPKKDWAGSWIAGQSIPLQLMTQPCLTVDLTVDELLKPTPYNMPIDSLCDLASNGFLYLNIRDYDSKLNEICHGVVAERMEKIVDRCRNQIYIGSALRDPLFNGALRWWQGSDTKETLSSIQQNAQNAMTKAYTAFITTQNRDVLDSIFRNESVGLVPASWHYAFLTCFRSKLDQKFFLGNRGIVERLKEVMELGDVWERTKTPRHQELAACAFANFAGDLRILHQIYTAPITASWGTTYNLRGDEYEKNLNFAVDRLVPKNEQVRSEDYNRFLFFVFRKKFGEDHPYIRELAAVKAGSPSLHLNGAEAHNFDKATINTLIGILTNRRDDLLEMRSLQGQIDQCYLSGRDGSLGQLLREYEKSANGFIRKSVLPFLGGVTNSAIAYAVGGPALVGIILPTLMDTLKINFPKSFLDIFSINGGNRNLYKIHSIAED